MFKMVPETLLLLVLASSTFAVLDESILSEETKELLKTLRSTCVEKTQVDEEHIKKVNTAGTFPEDDKLKCYTKCILEEVNAVDADGLVNFEVLKEILPEKLRGPVRQIINACNKKAVTKDLCQHAFDFHKCASKQDPENYFLV